MRWKEAKLAILGLVLVSSLACQLLTPELAEDEEDLKATISAQRTVIARQAGELGVTIEAPATDETPQALESSGYPSLLWEMELDEEPLVDDTAVYYIDQDGKVACANLTTGERVWSWEWYEVAERLLAQTDGLIYALREDGRVYAVDKATGESLWKHRIDGPDRVAVSIVDGVMYLQTGGVGVVALDPQTGQTLWQVPYSLAGIWAEEPRARASEYIFAHSREDNAVILDPITGECEAEFGPVGQYGGWEGDLVSGEVFLQVDLDDGWRLHALEYGSWQEQWQCSGQHYDTLDGAVLLWFYEDREFSFRAVDIETGQPLWSQPEERQEYVGTTGQLAFFYSTALGETKAVEVADGDMVWINDELRADSIITGTVDGILMAQSEEGRLFYVDWNTGDVLWSFAHERESDAKDIWDVVIQGNEVLVSVGSSLYSIDLQTGELRWQEHLFMRYYWEGARKIRTLDRNVVVTSSEYVAVFEYWE